jgi:hypothetical protein
MSTSSCFLHPDCVSYGWFPDVARFALPAPELPVVSRCHLFARASVKQTSFALPVSFGSLPSSGSLPGLMQMFRQLRST